MHATTATATATTMLAAVAQQWQLQTYLQHAQAMSNLAVTFKPQLPAACWLQHAAAAAIVVIVTVANVVVVVVAATEVAVVVAALH